MKKTTEDFFIDWCWNIFAGMRYESKLRMLEGVYKYLLSIDGKHIEDPTRNILENEDFIILYLMQPHIQMVSYFLDGLKLTNEGYNIFQFMTENDFISIWVKYYDSYRKGKKSTVCTPYWCDCAEEDRCRNPFFHLHPNDELTNQIVER